MDWRKILFLVFVVLVLTNCAELLQQQNRQLQAARLAELERRCQEYQIKYYQLIQKLQEEEKRYRLHINELGKELTSLKESSQKKEEELGIKNEELEFTLRSKEKELELKEEKYKATLSVLNNQINELKSVIEKLEREKQETAQRVATTQEEKDQLQQENQKLIAQIDEQQQALTQKEKEIISQQELVGQLQADKLRLTMIGEGLQQKINSLRQELEIAKKQGLITPTSGTQPQINLALKEALPIFQQLLSIYINKDNAKVTLEKRGLVITIQNETLHQPGTVILSNEGEQILARITEEIKKLPLEEIIVEGHTDNQPLQDLPFFDNWALGASRANNIVRYLIEQGVEPKKTKALSAAFYQPVASNDTPEGRRKNRRVEIILK